MPVVGIAEVLVKPVFSGTQRAISKEMGPAADRAGRSAGSQMGKGMASGFAAETAGLEAEVARLGKAVSQAENTVTASKTKMADASAAESKALGELRVAELKLQEIRENSRAKASQVAAAEEKLEIVRGRAAAATSRREAAERNLAAATTNLGTAQQNASTASADLETHMRRVSDESANAERNVGRLGTMLRTAFTGNPLARMVDSMRGDGDRMRMDLHKLAQDVSREGTRGGRAFTQAFIGVVGGLSALTPAAGAAGASVLAASGNVLTFAASLSSLAGLAALAPAGLMAIGGAAGVLAAAFSGVGDALKAVTEQQNAFTTNPRLAAMAIEDAAMAITVAEENAAEAQENAARRVADAKRNLQDVTLAAAEAQKSAAKAVEMAERSEAKAARDVIQAQKDLVEAREEAAKRVDEVGRKLFDADRKAVDAALAYKTAVDTYNKAKADPKSSADLLTQLSNNVAKAMAADDDAKRSVAELGDEHKKAKAEAKAGSEAVLKAEQKLADARQAQADAVQARKDAQADAVKAEQDGAKRIADAQQAITDATRQSEKAQRDAARAVEQAHRNLERVQMQQADTAARAGDKSTKAMAELTPAAQAAVGALLAVKDQLGGIRRIAQENFFKGFASPLMSLADTLMPQLAVGVGSIATALGGGAQTLMGSLEKALGGGVLETLLTGIADSIAILNKAIDPFVQAFTTLGVVGMEYMPRLAEWIVKMADKFNAFIQTAAADGSLNKWIEDGIQALKDLWTIADSIGGIFGALNDAAAAGGFAATLGGMAGWLRDVEAVMQGEVFQTTMATIFSGAAAGAKGLLDAIGPIGDAFERGAPALARFLELGGQIAGTFLGGVFTALSNPEFGAGLVTFMEGLKAGAEEAAPLLSGLTGAFGRILEVAGPIVAELGPSLVEVFTFFADSIANVMTVLSPMLTAIAGSPVLLGLLIGAFVATAAASAALTAAGNVQRIAMGLWTTATWLWTNGTKAAKFMLDLFSKSVKAFPGMWIITIIGLVVGALVWLYNNNEDARRTMDAAWKGIQTAIKWAWDHFIKPTFDAIVWFVKNVLAPLFDWLWKTIIKPSFDGIGAAIKWVWENVLRPVFKTLGDFITKTIPDAFKRGVGFIKTHWEKLQEIAKKPVRFVVDQIINKGLIDGLNGIGNFLNLPDIPHVQLPKGFHRGGVLPGYEPRKRDTVLTPMRPGEGVLVPEVVRGAGRAFIDTLNAAGNRGVGAVRELMANGFHPGRAKGGLIHPLPNSIVSSGFGPRAGGFHNGIDFAAPAGTPVRAAGPGRVSQAAWSPHGGGNEVKIDHPNGLQTWYAHLSSFAVSLGQMVKAGTRVGGVGTTGNSTGNHLHYMVLNGGWPNYINPAPFLGGGGDIPEGGRPWNPIADIIGGLVDGFKKAFPAAGFIADLAIGAGKKLMDGAVAFVTGQAGEDKNAKGNALGVPYLHDNGGVLNPGLSMILNRTRKPEAIYNFEQNRALQTLAARGADAGGRGDVIIKGNVGWDPHEVAHQIETKRRDTFAAFGI